MNLRDIRQNEWADKWLQSKRNSILNLCPRSGKIKTSINILQKAGFQGDILICYPNTPIKQSWEDDFQKWNYSNSNIKFSTFLSLKNELKNQFELIIIDEIHSLSEAQIDCIIEYKKNYPGTQFLGLTGTLSKNTELELRDRLKMDICEKYTIEQAISEGVVSDYLIKIITVPLDNQIYNDYSTKKSKIKRTEKQQFDYLSNSIDRLSFIGRNTFFLRLARMRLIQNSHSKLLKTKQLLTSNNRSLIFCGSTKIADSLGCQVYHSKKKEESDFLDYCSGKGNHLAVVKLAQAGVTFKNLDNVIFNYTDSNEENFTQKINRCMNYDYKDKIANIIIVSSNETVEINWLKKALKPLEKSKIIWT